MVISWDFMGYYLNWLVVEPYLSEKYDFVILDD